MGMGEDLLAGSARARDVFNRASEALGFDVEELCVSDPEERLNLTEYTQPALLTVSMAVWETLKKYDVNQPAMAAGLSLGEYSALVAGGALDLEKACVLVRKRGKYMQEAVPEGVGTMAAIIGLEAETVQQVCREVEELRGGIVRGANFNCPGQVVISGDTETVAAACEALKAKGARRAIMLRVSAPFHSPLMESAQRKLAVELEDTQIREPEFPIITNVEARATRDPGEIRESLVRQVSSPVRWEESVRVMVESGIDTFVEAGPGNTLRGFLGRIDRSLNGLGCEKPNEIEEVAGQL